MSLAETVPIPSVPHWEPELIRELRLRYRMTQEHFAEHLGVNQATVSAWENGSARPQVRHLLKLDRLADEVKFA